MSDRFQRRLSSQGGRAMAGTSRVNREVYARFCGRLEVKFLRPTRRPADQPEQGVAAGRHGEALGQACAGLTAQSQPKVALDLAQAPGATRPGSGGDGGQAFGEDPPGALGGGAAKAARLDPDQHGTPLPGQIGEGSEVPAVDPARGVTGQQASSAFGAVVTVSADGTTCWTSRPEGIRGRMCLDKPVTGSTGCSWYVRIPRRFAHQRHQDCGRAAAYTPPGTCRDPRP